MRVGQVLGGGLKRQEIRQNKTGNAENTMASQDLAGFFWSF